VLFPFFSPVLGWIGVFLTGSDASSNALFGKLQATSATTIGIDPVLTVSANASGGVMGKMISPQSIAVGAAAVGLVGKESELIRFTLKHSFILLLIVCIITTVQAYFIRWMIPEYNLIDPVSHTAGPDNAGSFIYLLALALILILIAAGVILTDRKKIKISGCNF
jgi:lactate permease